MPDSQPIETRNGVSYATHDGVSLPGDLYLPAGAGPFPALVGVHGGGWQAGARNAFQFWGPYLAARGYALFAISYRLARGPEDVPQAVNDVLAAVQFVRGSAGELKIDPERIGLFGASAGGHLASLAALGGASFQSAYPNDAHAKVSSKVKALIGVYGVYDLVEMWQRYLLQSPRENNIENFMGASPMDDPKLYFEASSINYATFANNHIGVLLSVGTEDDLVDRRDAYRRISAAVEAGELLRAHLHRAGRAALLAQRSDRGARELFRLHGAAPHPLPDGAAVVAIRAFSGKVNFRFSVENATTQRIWSASQHTIKSRAISSGTNSRSAAKSNAGPPIPATPLRPSTNGSSIIPRNWLPIIRLVQQHGFWQRLGLSAEWQRRPRPCV